MAVKTEAKFRRLSAIEILALDDITWEDVEVPEWNAMIRIRALSGLERDRLETSMVSERNGNRSINFANFRAKLIAASAVDEEGHPVFTQEQVKPLGEKNAGALARLFDVASRLSGYTERDVKELTIDLGNDLNAELGSA